MNTKKEERKKVYEKYNGLCAYCGDILWLDSFNVDHMIPKKKGGTNEFKNLMPSCRSCNSWKSVWTIDEFREVVYSQLNKLRKYSSGYKLLMRMGLIEQSATRVIFHFETKDGDGRG